MREKVYDSKADGMGLVIDRVVKINCERNRSLYV